MADLLLLPFGAAVTFVLIHAYFGVHVLRRKIVFADLALAQLSALGATVAFANGYPAASMAGFAYALLFTAFGAALLTLSRPLARVVSQEAFVGILYVVATAATVLLVDRLPQGAEHVKKMLIGSILMVAPADLARFAALYATIGAVHWCIRRPLLALANETHGAGGSPGHVWGWDFLFYVSFGLVVTSSVSTAGVLLVFSFLIVPAVIGTMFSQRIATVLAIAWTAGIGASAAGLVGSYVLDLPTGAAMVTMLAFALVLAGMVKFLTGGTVEHRRHKRKSAARALAASALVVVLGSAVWLVAKPTADQPVLNLFERATGLEPASFLRKADQEIYRDAARDVVRFQGEVDRLNAMERQARYRGATLSDDEVRRIASYQQSFNEMVRGERFVQDVLRGKARERERWLLGLPALLLALAGLALLSRPRLFLPRRMNHPPAAVFSSLLARRGRAQALRP